MEWFGIAALIIILCYSSYPQKIKRLEAKIKSLERIQKGTNNMSKLISDLVGKNCKIRCDDALRLTGSAELACYVLDSDDEWLKIRFTDKKNRQITKLIRTESIEEIEEINE